MYHIPKKFSQLHCKYIKATNAGFCSAIPFMFILNFVLSFGSIASAKTNHPDDDGGDDGDGGGGVDDKIKVLIELL